MKKLENFKTEKTSLSKIFGGEIVGTYSSSTSGNCTTTIQDTYDDVNGNGKRDKNESMSICTSTVCS